MFLKTKKRPVRHEHIKRIATEAPTFLNSGTLRYPSPSKQRSIISTSLRSRSGVSERLPQSTSKADSQTASTKQSSGRSLVTTVSESHSSVPLSAGSAKKLNSISGVTGPRSRGSLDYWIRPEIVLKPYQEEGVKWLKNKKGAILGDEMGLGKTIQALFTFGMHIWAAVKKDPDKRCVMVAVVPASLRMNWADEIEKFTKLEYCVVSGSGVLERFKQIEEFKRIDNHKILVLNYEILGDHIQQLNSMNVDFICADEAHVIKNKETNAYKNISQIAAGRRLAMTGTPMTNQVDDLWTLLDWVTPGQWGTFAGFKAKYCNTPDAPIWMADGTFKPLGEVKVGDKVMGWKLNPANGRRVLCESEVELTHSRVAPMVIESTLGDGSKIKCTPDHRWLNPHSTDSEREWVTIGGNYKPTRRGNKRKRYVALSRVVNPVGEIEDRDIALEAAWLGGIWDGEGGGRGFIGQDIDHNPETYARIQEALDMLEIPFRSQPSGIQILGGRQSYVKILNWCNITRNKWFKEILHTQINRTSVPVVNVKELGPGEVISMQTTTGNYVAWGLASKNCVLGGFNGKQVTAVKNERQLYARLSQVMLRREIDNVIDLPDVNVIKRMVSLVDKPREMYNYLATEHKLQKYVPTMTEEQEEALEWPMVRQLRMRQICSSTCTLVPSWDESPKLDLAIEDACEILDNGHKLIVFTQFMPIVYAYKRRLEAARPGTKVFEIHGNVNKDKRVPITKEWAAVEGPAVMIGIIKAMGVGLNMTAANHCQFVGKEFSPGLNDQCIGRLRRVGSEHHSSITVLDYMVRNSAEYRVEQIIKDKEFSFDAVIRNGSKGSVNSSFMEKLNEALEGTL